MTMGMTSYWSTNQVHRNLNLFHGVEILMYIGTESDEESAGALLPGNSSVPKKGTYANKLVESSATSKRSEHGYHPPTTCPTRASTGSISTPMLRVLEDGFMRLTNTVNGTIL